MCVYLRWHYYKYGITPVVVTLQHYRLPFIRYNPQLLTILTIDNSLLRIGCYLFSKNCMLTTPNVYYHPAIETLKHTMLLYPPPTATLYTTHYTSHYTTHYRYLLLNILSFRGHTDFFSFKYRRERTLAKGARACHHIIHAVRFTSFASEVLGLTVVDPWSSLKGVAAPSAYAHSFVLVVSSTPPGHEDV
jgi:hypothetical protein